MDHQVSLAGKISGSVYSFLVKSCIRMDSGKLSHGFYQLMKQSGLIKFGHIIFNQIQFRYPTQQMLQEKEFFLQHKDDLKMVYDLLADSASKQVYEQILRFRCTRKAPKELLNNPETQYFVPEIQLTNQEVFVDCGAFIGDTIEQFYKHLPAGRGGTKARAVALEPEPDNYVKLSALQYEGLTTYPYGAWSENTVLKFLSERAHSSTFSEEGNIELEVRALDYISECQEATYIKMDIEGSELQALKGAEQIIRRNKPKLAICLYHKPQDFFEIPLYIKSLVPDYKLYVHHHSFDVCETVLYAVAE